ncbi:MAG: hypothetical protein MHM6MM_002736 [Cercozoa sp. M6MM]
MTGWQVIGPLTLFQLAALGLFMSGFFLTRYELTDHTSCEEVPTIMLPDEVKTAPPAGSCWHEQDEKAQAETRVILFLVDALRFDFVDEFVEDVDFGDDVVGGKFDLLRDLDDSKQQLLDFDISALIKGRTDQTTNESGEPADDVRADGRKHYEHRMPRLRQMLSDESERVRKYRFRADAPTATMLRLKALMTGGLPTFVDVSANFGADAVEEDNLLTQIKRAGKKAEFAGDDTWMSLFPTEFAKNDAFDSFDVYDLDSVDRGVTEILFNRLRKQIELKEQIEDFDFYVAHVLGVDHVGHRFRPEHPTMRRKLRQVDAEIALLKRHVELLDQADGKRTWIFVAGDHGMTSEGNHGGASIDETDAALVVIAPSANRFDQNDRHDELVMQVDLTTTLATLLNVPVPFGGVGTLIPDVALSHVANNGISTCENWQKLVQFQATHLAQFWRYLLTYDSVSKSFGAAFFAHHFEEAHRVFEKLQQAQSLACDETKLTLLREAFSDAVASARTLLQECRQKWSTFDPLAVYGGVLFLLVSVPLATRVTWHAVSAAAATAAALLLVTVPLATSLLLALTVATVVSVSQLSKPSATLLKLIPKLSAMTSTVTSTVSDWLRDRPVTVLLLVVTVWHVANQLGNSITLVAVPVSHVLAQFALTLTALTAEPSSDQVLLNRRSGISNTVLWIIGAVALRTIGFGDGFSGPDSSLDTHGSGVWHVLAAAPSLLLALPGLALLPRGLNRLCDWRNRRWEWRNACFSVVTSLLLLWHWHRRSSTQHAGFGDGLRDGSADGLGDGSADGLGDSAMYLPVRLLFVVTTVYAVFLIRQETRAKHGYVALSGGTLVLCVKRVSVPLDMYPPPQARRRSKSTVCSEWCLGYCVWCLSCVHCMACTCHCCVWPQ